MTTTTATHSDPAAPAYGFVPRRTVLLRSVRDRAARARLERDQLADRLGLAGPGEVPREDVVTFQRSAAEAQYAHGVARQVCDTPPTAGF